MDSKRLDNIEMALAHQAQQIEDLSQMTFLQGKEIEKLKRQLEAAKSQLADLESGAKDAKSEVGLSNLEVAILNKPPHY